MKKLLTQINDFNCQREWDSFHSPDSLSKSISIEAAELLECFQWDIDYRIEDVKDEIADVFICTLLLAQKLDLDLNQIVLDKLKKNEEKYPVDKSKGNSRKYDDI